MTTGEHMMADAAAMRRALELAERGPAHGVNPQVGCVILSPHGDVLAEGWHRGAGTAHAEVDALSKLAPGARRRRDRRRHPRALQSHGRTGPCAEALIDAGIGGSSTPSPTRATTPPAAPSGCAPPASRSTGGVLADEVEALLDDWLFAARHRRPHVTVKWAQSLDGRAAASDGTSQWITGPAARADVHRRRAAADAIVVGTGTVLADDPALTARAPDGAFFDAQPIPVVFGRRPVPGDAAITRHPHAPVFVDGADLAAVLADLRIAASSSLFVEGGPTLASAFLAAGLVDEVLAYVAPVLLGGPRLALGDLGVATIADARRLAFASVERLGDDLLVVAHPRPTKGTDMFTGIVEEIGAVTRVERSADAVRLTVRAPKAVQAAEARRLDLGQRRVPDRRRPGRRLVHGRRHGADARDVDARRRPRGAAVNLERATGRRPPRRPHRAGPHRRHRRGARGPPGRAWRVLRISLADALAPLVVDKGSIAVDGVSLTVSALGDEPAGSWFEVSLIPETLEATTLGRRAAGDRVNLETDILARHVQRMLRFRAPVAALSLAEPAATEQGASHEPCHDPRGARRPPRRQARHRRRR